MYSAPGDQPDLQIPGLRGRVTLSLRGRVQQWPTPGQTSRGRW